MKSGANRIDRNEIGRLAEKGMGAEDISKKLRIEQECVEAFMPNDIPALSNDDKMAVLRMADSGNDAEEIAEDLELDLGLVTALMEED